MRAAASARVGAIREREPGRSAGERQQRALGDELPDEPRAPGAERRPDGHLGLARGRPREQQVRDVDAGDQQDEADGAEQHFDRELRVADERVEQRPRGHADLLVVGGICLLERGADRATSEAARSIVRPGLSRPIASRYHAPRLFDT